MVKTEKTIELFACDFCGEWADLVCVFCRKDVCKKHSGPLTIEGCYWPVCPDCRKNTIEELFTLSETRGYDYPQKLICERR